MCPLLGATENKIDDAIGQLVKEGKIGLDVQKALDSLRVIGNESVLPGIMDMKDDFETAIALFNVLNIIVERTISYDKQIEELWGKIPNSKKEHIKKRDTIKP